MLKMIFDTYKAFVLKLIQLFFPWNRKVDGKLCVSGRGAFELEFKTYPQDVHVVFLDEPNVFPCNPCDPGTADKLHWKVKRDDDMYILTIHWNVVGMRTIGWVVCE